MLVGGRSFSRLSLNEFAMFQISAIIRFQLKILGILIKNIPFVPIKGFVFIFFMA